MLGREEPCLPMSYLVWKQQKDMQTASYEGNKIETWKPSSKCQSQRTRENGKAIEDKMKSDPWGVSIIQGWLCSL